MKEFLTLSVFVLALSFLLPSPLRAQNVILGHWEGSIAQPTVDLKLAIDIENDGDGFAGSFNVPAAAVFKFPLNVSYDAPKVEMRLPGFIFFDGKLQGNKLSGKISFQGKSFLFNVSKRSKPSPVYREEEVTFKNGAITLAGTLRIPLTKGRHAAMFLLQGSGGTDRSGEQFYADYFARRGFVTLVYDKRGTGKSSGNWEIASFDDFADDALAGIHYLQSRREVDARKVGLWGRSHGAMVAPLAASRSKDVAFMVDISGNTLPVTENIIYGTEGNMRRAGFSEAEIKEADAFMKQKYEVARTGKGWEQFLAKVEELKSKNSKWLTQYAGVPKSLDDLQYFWKAQFSYDPSAFWRKVKQPVLAIYGGADSSQPIPEITATLEKALKTGGNKDHKIKVFPEADHAILVWPKEDNPPRFPVLANDYLATILAWLK